MIGKHSHSPDDYHYLLDKVQENQLIEISSIPSFEGRLVEAELKNKNKESRFVSYLSFA